MSIASGPMRAFARSQRLRALGWFGYAFALLAFAVALAVRLWLGDALQGYPYVTFFPAVVLTIFEWHGAGAGAGTLAVVRFPE